ncbi:MAG: hypothetical protein DLM73_07845 [Chthoniobacterales bacterium]|nr:MAG: hypothetical protein DLM73_07845 [Chthoniobacterales bacterium]
MIKRKRKTNRGEIGLATDPRIGRILIKSFTQKIRQPYHSTARIEIVKRLSMAQAVAASGFFLLFNAPPL